MSEFVDRLTKDTVALLVVQPFHYDLSDLSRHSLGPSRFNFFLCI